MIEVGLSISATRGVVAPGRPSNPSGILCKPVIQALAPKTPVAVERVLEAETADPPPAPVITSPISFVIGGAVIRWVIVVVSVPFAAGKSSTGSRIKKRPVIIE